MTVSKLEGLINTGLAIIGFIGVMILMSGVFMMDSKEIAECVPTMICGAFLTVPGVTRMFEVSHE